MLAPYAPPPPPPTPRYHPPLSCSCTDYKLPLPLLGAIVAMVMIIYQVSVGHSIDLRACVSLALLCSIASHIPNKLGIEGSGQLSTYELCKCQLQSDRSAVMI